MFDKFKTFWLGLFNREKPLKYEPTNDEVEAYWAEHREALVQEALEKFYKFLDLQSLFGGQESSMTGIATWISLGVSIVTLILVIRK